ncbi:SDR family oxidoreductase [Mesorhizobium sp. M0500]|uniref:SDR family oxidoreductase n=1 Tax=Mesorhizobium sp. M0500 TaxID=2956953 RepID=UPI00333BA4A1
MADIQRGANSAFRMEVKVTTGSSKIALVTGGSTGIGAATCRLLCEQGWALGVNYRHNRTPADRVVADIERAGGRAVPVQGDVANEAEVARMFGTLDREFGTLTALVNCAGIVGRRGRFIDLDPAGIRQVIKVNLLGTMYCSLEAIRRMSTRRGGQGGAIVNISSGLSKTGGALSPDPVFQPDPEGKASGGRVPYSTSKGAINSFTVALAQEVAREGIRVNTVSPGPTRTDLPDPIQIAEAEVTIPIGRAADAREIAEAIVWLLSDNASYVAGAYLRVGGGRIG